MGVLRRWRREWLLFQSITPPHITPHKPPKTRHIQCRYSPSERDKSCNKVVQQNRRLRYRSPLLFSVRVAPGCTRLYQVVPGCTRLYQVAPGCTRLYQVAPGCTRLYRLYQVVPGCTGCTRLHRLYQVAPGCTRLYQVAPVVPGCTRLHRLYQVVPGCTGCTGCTYCKNCNSHPVTPYISPQPAGPPGTRP